MPSKKASLKNGTPKMLEPQQQNPERLLPAGHHHPVLHLFYYLVLNVFIFVMVYGISLIFFRQGNKIALVAAESATAFTLLVSLVMWIKFRHQG